MILNRDPLSNLLTLSPSRAVRSLHTKQLNATRGVQRFRAWLAGRRSGKSYAAAVWLLGGQKGQISVYCARTLKSAKGIMIQVFRELNSKYNLGLDIRASTGTITEPNGHVIQLFGIRDQGAADLMRGLSKLRRVFIDEAGAFTDDLLKYSIESILQPMLLDLKGDMCVSGTPGVIPKGYFYDITGNPGLEKPVVGRWKTYHWDYRDNPHVAREEVIAEAMSANGMTPEHATFKREYGAIWCEDLDAIIYRYKCLYDSQGKPLLQPVPPSGLTVMTIDFGVKDHTAWAVGRQPYDKRPHVWVLSAYSAPDLLLPAIAAKTRELRQRFNVNKIYSDEGGLGLALANNLRDQYKIPIEPVYKPHKRAKIDVVRGRLDAETLHLCEEARGVLEEWLTLCWDEKREDHHPRMLDDLSDVICYLCWAPEFAAYEMPKAPPVVVDEMSELKRKASLKAMRGPGLGNF